MVVCSCQLVTVRFLLKPSLPKKHKHKNTQTKTHVDIRKQTLSKKNYKPLDEEPRMSSISKTLSGHFATSASASSLSNGFSVLSLIRGKSL